MKKSHNFINDEFILKFKNEENLLRKKNLFTDITLKSSDGEEFKVHKVVLAAAVPYFKTMLEWELNENSKRIEDYTMEKINAKRLETILEYIYTGKIEITIENAKDFYVDGNFLMFHSLKHYSNIVLIEQISAETVLEFFEFAEKQFNSELETSCINYILINSDALFELNSFLSITEAQFKKILIEDRISSKEEAIFSFAIKWIEHDLDNRKFFVDFILSQIRFTEISTDFMSKEVLGNKTLQENRKFLEISMNLLKFNYDCNIIHRKDVPFNIPKFAEPRLRSYIKQPLFISCTNIAQKRGDLFTPKSKFSFSTDFAAASFGKNFLLIAGGANTKECNYYCPILRKLRSFPAMNEIRFKHGLTTLNDKIYSCGGRTNSKTVEVFDIDKGVWLVGPNMNHCEYDFGIATGDQCIYAVGGLNAEKSGSFERLDPREPTWQKLQHFEAISSDVRACMVDDVLYAFNHIGGKQYDTRAAKWLDGIIAGPIKTSLGKSGLEEGVSTLSETKINAVGHCDRNIYIAGIDGKSNYVKEYNIVTKNWKSHSVEEVYQSIVNLTYASSQFKAYGYPFLTPSTLPVLDFASIAKTAVESNPPTNSLSFALPSTSTFSATATTVTRGFSFGSKPF